MPNKIFIKTLPVLIFLSGLLNASAQVLHTLYSLNGTNGMSPNQLTLGQDGNFYGSTFYGGGFTNDIYPYGMGTLFRVTTNGTFTTLNYFNFTNGSNPSEELILGEDGFFYGTTSSGGANSTGIIFKMDTNGSLHTLVSFDLPDFEPESGIATNANGAGPGALTLAPEKNYLYGTTSYGGTDGSGTFFKVSTNGVLSTLASFNFAGTFFGAGKLVMGNDGAFYDASLTGGITNSSFPLGMGMLFKITTNGELDTLVIFNDTNGAEPADSLILDNNGNFYGVTVNGGANDDGTIFKMTTNGIFTTLISFNFTNGATPDARLKLGKDGNFYGSTFYGGITNDTYPYGMGTLFKTTTAGNLTTLIYFNGTNGAGPAAGLITGDDGNFYGTTQSGGDKGYGTIFSLSINPLPSLTLQFSGDYPLLSLNGTIGNCYTLQYSTNLAPVNWVNLFSISNLNVIPFQFLDSSGLGQTSRFYRAVGH